jgi:hypothetical protein
MAVSLQEEKQSALSEEWKLAEQKKSPDDHP